MRISDGVQTCALPIYNFQQADTGTKMIHLGKNTRSRIIAKGISAGRSDATYRGLVRIGAKAEGARNFTQCDSLLIGDKCGAHTVPYIENKNRKAIVEHEATTSRVAEDVDLGQREHAEAEAHEDLHDHGGDEDADRTALPAAHEPHGRD